jgi:phosphatidylglycerophosphate synthase
VTVLDERVRRFLAPPLRAAGGRLARWGVTPHQLTAGGFVLGMASAGAASRSWWAVALVLWLASRVLDGLDGAVARVVGASQLGGFLDVVADFTVYGSFVVGVAVAVPGARLACAVLLLTYYVNGTALLALAAVTDHGRLERRGERSIRFVGGPAEGTETIVAHSLFCLLPAAAAVIAWIFAAAVAATAAWRVGIAVRVLRL